MMMGEIFSLVKTSEFVAGVTSSFSVSLSVH